MYFRYFLIWNMLLYSEGCKIPDMLSNFAKSEVCVRRDLVVVVVVVVVVEVVLVEVVVIIFPDEYDMIHSIHTTFQQFHKCIPLEVARKS